MFRLVLLVALACGAAMFAPQLMENVVANAPADGGKSQSVQRGYQAPATTQRATGGTMVLKAASNGHYYAKARINSRPVDVLVDSGASVVAVPFEVARSIGIHPSPSAFTVKTHTANGIAYSAPVTFREIRIGSIRVANVRGLVAERGSLSITLLGMSFLGRLSRADMRDGELIMKP